MEPLLRCTDRLVAVAGRNLTPADSTLAREIQLPALSDHAAVAVGAHVLDGLLCAQADAPGTCVTGGG